jgi:hypothetical protein
VTAGLYLALREGRNRSHSWIHLAGCRRHLERKPAGTGKIEPLPSLGYEGLRKQSPAISVDANLPEAGQRLVRLYTARGKPDQAGEWRRKLNFATN